MILMCEYIIVTQVHWDDGAHRWRGQWKRVPNQTTQVDPLEHPFALDGCNTIAPCSRSHKFGYLDGWDTIAPYSQSHIFAGSTTRRRLQNMVLKVSLRWSTLTRLTSQELNIEKIKQTHSLIKNKLFSHQRIPNLYSGELDTVDILVWMTEQTEARKWILERNNAEGNEHLLGNLKTK